MWAGSDDGLIHVTRDGGDNWENVTPPRMPEWSMINSIDIDPFNGGGVYVAATRYKLDDFRPYLYHTTDWGKSWRRIDGGLPADHFTRVLRADPEREGLLYAGTERGLYFSTNGGGDWRPLQLNLPVVPITDMLVKGDDLVAATQGRGYWILDDLGVLRQLGEGGDAPVLYTPDDTYRLIAGGRDDDAKNAGTNPYPGVTIYYHLPEELAGTQDLTLSVHRAGSDDAIWTWTAEPGEGEEEEKTDGVDTRVLATKAGLNRHVWNLEYPGMSRFEGLVLWADMKEGPMAVPGEYEVRMSVGDASQSTTFSVLVDPRATATQADYEAQFAFVSEARDLLSRTHDEIKRIRVLRKEMQSVRDRIEGAEGSEELIADIEAIDATITAVEEALYQTQNESRQDPLNYPIRLNNKLTALMRLVSRDDVGPTTQALEVKAMLSAAIESELASLDEIWEQRVPALNAAIREREIDMIPPRDTGN
jgi:hypothetical protein